MVDYQTRRNRAKGHFVRKPVGRRAFTREEDAVVSLGFGAHPRPTFVYALDLAVFGEAFGRECHGVRLVSQRARLSAQGWQIRSSSPTRSILIHRNRLVLPPQRWQETRLQVTGVQVLSANCIVELVVVE